MSAPEAPETDEQTITSLAADVVELRRQVAELSSEHELTAALTVLDTCKEIALHSEVPGGLRVAVTDALIRLLFVSFNVPLPYAEADQ